MIAEGAAGCAIAAALSGRAGTGKVVAVVSGGNIDLTKFASLVGACDVTSMTRYTDRSRHSPNALERLEELAVDLWWSWHRDARVVFRRLDLTAVAHDRAQPGAHALAGEPASGSRPPPPIRTSWRFTIARSRRSTTTRDRAEHVVGPHSFRSSADRRSRTSRPSSRCTSRCRFTPADSASSPATTARKPATSAFRSSASGFMYPQGYFHQHISAEGWQEESYERLNWADAAIEPATTPDGKPCVTAVPLGDRSVLVAVWRVQVGRVTLFLLDTDLEENAPWDRDLSARLYGGDRETRIQQEIILGIGGVRALKALGMEPGVFHLNEGHAGFVVLQRIRDLLESGVSFEDALDGHSRDHDLHDAHAGRGGPRRLSIPPRREAPRERVGHARRAPRPFSRARRATTTATARSST